MIKSRYLPPVYLGTRLVILYAKCDSLEDARNVLDGMPERNIVSWTAMISGYSQRGCHAEALELFIRMLRTGLLPNEFTLASVLTSCSGPCGFEHGRQVHSLVVKTNFESHIFVGSSLLDMYAKADKIHEARRVFDMLPKRDVVSCTAIISGYAQLGLDEEALELFRKLYEEGMECNYVTFASLLTALSGLSALDYGRQVHSLTIRRELPFYVVLQNSLIDMYSKCGCLICARRVFDSMPERTVISWNAMLVGLGKHGLGRQVLQLFKSMREELKPDGVTFMAVLSGCSHGGLVDEGLDVFDYMLNEQGLKPEHGHYGCVVDLLGRAGRIEKALDFIEDMPFEPTAAMWGSLLGACRVHANASVGDFVAQRLLEIEPENAGNYRIQRYDEENLIWWCFKPNGGDLEKVRIGRFLRQAHVMKALEREVCFFIFDLAIMVAIHAETNRPKQPLTMRIIANVARPSIMLMPVGSVSPPHFSHPSGQGLFGCVDPLSVYYLIQLLRISKSLDLSL
ncbi:putative pentatricopeptide repeat-containing protein, mitochondrial [Cocos nucifera]|uniref:Putative pentatricopeptide repeat-containing protein, mitochondrial n=1 Tax=Cocos nucifera TaxID=13894 RepID=A0A8K0N9W2_COCNU|nr:putative pentatricopeptide repeat-containing protein, mitochondrial [Cocos nucifera]